MKLTNVLRDDYIRKITDKKFSEKKAALDEYAKKFIPEVTNQYLNYIFTSKELEWISSCPDSLKLWQTLYLKNGNYTEILRFDIFLPKVKAFENFFLHCITDKDLKDRITAYWNDYEKTKKDYETLKSELHRLFYSVTTTKRLLEVFPEITDYIVIEESKISVPAVQDFSLLRGLLNV